MSLNVLEPPSASMPLNVREPYIKPAKEQEYYTEDLSQGQERVPLVQEQVHEEGCPVLADVHDEDGPVLAVVYDEDEPVPTDAHEGGRGT